MRRSALAAALFACLAVAVPAASAAPAPGTTSVFAKVGAPGHADSTLLLPGGDVLVSTNRGARGSTGPSKLFRFDPAGRLIRTYTVSGQDLAGDHGVMSMALDGQGRVYVADYAPPRVLRFDLRSGRQTTYATVPDLTGAADNGVGDSKPWPDGVTFLPDGRLLVTDLAQGTVFAVPPGGGAPAVWLQDPLLRSTFGPNQLVLTPAGDLLLDVTTSTAPATAGRGVLYRFPLTGGRPGPLTQVWASRPGEGPDGFTLGRSGRVYMPTLVTDRIVVIAPDGAEISSYGSPGGLLDSPSSVTLQGDGSALVTNLTYFTNDTSHDLVLRMQLGDTPVPVARPAVR
ncbi:MAG: hypothetical protein LC789_00790 [Actinobacteria bacterium]|nr:hypothetical protein [Actinomycetota bacterium]MCA1721431.1 hypothetical protein [Actinomycetota bacterium]